MRRLVTALAVAGAIGTGAPLAAETGTIYATQPGLPAYDRDAHGGNPFATAVIAALSQPGDDLAQTLTERTSSASFDLQYPDLTEAGPDAQLVPGAGEMAHALVIVFADYGDEEGLISLPGAAFDAHRVGRALNAAGYEVTRVMADNASGYREALEAFLREAEGADRMLIYTTGHGFEVDGTVYLVPPDAEAEANMLTGAITLPEIRERIAGPGARLLLYAGCRDNPLDLAPLDFTVPAPAAPIPQP